MKRAVIFPVFCLILLSYCTTKTDRAVSGGEALPDSTTIVTVEEIDTVPKEIILEKSYFTTSIPWRTHTLIKIPLGNFSGTK